VYQERRVIGPPGTGKTTYLAARIQRAAENFGARLVIACSYTRSAAAEIAGRDTPLPPENVGTLHSQAFQACDRPKIVEVNAKERGEWNDSVADLWRIAGTGVTIGDSHAGAASLFAHYQDLRQRLVDPASYSPTIAALNKRWRQFEHDTGATDFVGLVERAIERHPEHPRHPGVLYVDEAQDLSPLLFKLARQWGEHCIGFVLAGDPDQAIYTFAGAAPEHLLTPKLPEAQRTVLSQSYRLPKAVHALARRWILGAPGRAEDAPYEPTDREGEVKRTGARLDAQRLAESATEGSTMGLALCGYQLNRVLNDLRAAGTPFHNPYRKKHYAWNPLGTPMAAAIHAWIIAPDDGSMPSIRTFAAFAKHTRTAGVWVRGKRAAFERFVKEQPRDEDAPLSEFALRAMWLPEAIAHYRSRDPLRFARHLVDTRRAAAAKPKQASYLARVVAAHGVDALERKPNLIVGTAHSVKGGEAERVFLAPAPSPEASRAYRANAPGARLAHYMLLYVAMTRARHSLIICGNGRSRGVPSP